MARGSATWASHRGRLAKPPVGGPGVAGQHPLGLVIVLGTVSHANIELMRHAADFLNAGDVDSYVALFAKDAVIVSDPSWPEQPEGGARHGHDAIRRWFAEQFEGWSEVVFSPRELRQAGDNVFGSWVWRATGAKSGLEMSSDWFSVSRVQDGLCVHLQFFANRDDALIAAGLQ